MGLQLVWISHMHADHHLGLLALLERRTALAPGRPLLVVGLHALLGWLRAAATALHTPLEFRYAHCATAPRDAGVAAALRRLRIDEMRVAPAEHCSDAWAVALQHADGWSLTYSGDTRPCESVVQLGRSMRPTCRLLLHECTFDDSGEMAREALARRHSTLSEALGVGARMGAWRVLHALFAALPQARRCARRADRRRRPRL